jgi:hypothetical protein
VRGSDLSGLAVRIAARIGATATRREIVVSGMVEDLVMGSGIDLSERGEQELRGLPGLWPLLSYRTESRSTDEAERLDTRPESERPGVKRPPSSPVLSALKRPQAPVLLCTPRVRPGTVAR